jgi:hypothetical protein
MSKGTKAFRKQARTAERVALQAGDAFVSDQMKTLAQAFRAQAEAMRKKRKKRKWISPSKPIVSMEN